MLPAPIAAKLAVRLQQMSSTTAKPLNQKEYTSLLDPLTEREREIALLMVQGCTNKEIAVRLFMSDGTIRNNISSIYSKVGTSDRIKAIHLLREHLGSDR